MFIRWVPCSTSCSAANVRTRRITTMPLKIARVVCQTEVPRPSTTGNRHLRGDLDNIVLKALQKGPARRYSSVEQLSEDVRRHLDGLPVAARPDTFVYRTGKFVRRHRLGLAAVAVLILALAGRRETCS
jgi:eukaryotic-like serine/threonine-protein kinase